MRDLVYVAATIAFFALGALYIAACARILAKSGDYDEAVDDEVVDDEAVGGREDAVA